MGSLSLFALVVVLVVDLMMVSKAASQGEWERTVEAARKEGTVVFATAAA